LKETFWVCNVCSPARCYLKSIGLATPTECVMSLNGIPRWESEQQASKSVEAQNSTSPNTTKATISLDIVRTVLEKGKCFMTIGVDTLIHEMEKIAKQ